MSEIALKVLEAMSPVFLAGLGWLSIKIGQWIAARTMNEYLKGCLTRLNDTVFAAVRELDQTTVAAIKDANADGKIDPADAANVKSAALANIKSHLGVKGLEELMRVFGLDGSALDKFLGTKVESAVQVVKLEKSAVSAAQIPQMPRA